MPATFVEPWTQDHNKVVNSDQTQFPVPVAGTFTWAKTIANGGRAVNGNSGFDIRPYSDSGLTSPLSYRLIAWDGTSGAFAMIVKRDISASVDTLIYFGVGDSSLTTDGSSTGAYKSTIKASYHGSVIDLTASGLNLTAVGAPGTVAGLIGNARTYDGATQYDWANGITAPFAAEPAAISAVIRQSSLTGGAFAGISVAANANFVMELGAAASGAVRATEAGTNQATGTGVMTVNAWNHMSVRFVTTTSRFAKGNLTAPTNGTGTTTNSTTPDTIYVGARATNAGHNNFCLADSNIVRFYNVDPGDDWFSTEYNSTIQFASFGSFGAEFPFGGGGGGIVGPRIGGGRVESGRLGVPRLACYSNQPDISMLRRYYAEREAQHRDFMAAVRRAA